MRAITPQHLLMTAFICFLFMAPVTAQDNPYQNAGTVTEYDIPITLDSTDTITNSAFDRLMAEGSENNPKAIGSDIVAFNGAGYSYRIGRVTITMNPLDMKSGESARIKGNTRSYGSDPVIEHEVYRDLIKERVILNSPRTLQYAYSLKLSDWVTREPDMSQPVEVQGADGTISVTYPHINEVTTLAADSTIDINPDPWGNLEVSVNDESVVVMPKPFAIDADGKRFELDYLLDKEAGTITITGDLTDAKYPVTIDPTERVTNGGFETGDTTGWWKSDAPELIVFSSEPYQGSYYCRYTGNGLSGFAGYTRMYQTIDYTGVPRVFGAVKIRSPNPYNFYLSDGYWDETANYSITFPKTPATGWVLKNATTNRSSTGKIAIWTHGSSSADIDSIRAIGLNTPVVQFTGSPASGTAPLTVYFTDQSTNSPTSWSWNFGDGGTSSAQNPSHTYTSSGTYTVRLTASNTEGTGDPSTKTNYISVSAPLPNAQFTASPTTGTAPLTVYFTDQSTNSPTSWSWNFGDGGTSSAQNPSHIYTSSGTYTVSLTVANAAGSDSEVKGGYVVTTISSQATDVAGRSMHQSEIEDVANKQQQMNYNSVALINPNADTVKARLPNDNLFVFTGHGGPGILLTSDTSAPSAFAARNTSDGNNFDDASSSYSNLKLAVFFACHTGITDPMIGNLVDVVVSKGAGCAMGWTELIASDGTHTYNSAFWNALQNGESIQQSHIDGLTASEFDPYCQSLESPPDDPDKYQYCLFEHLYQQGSSCSQPLPSGIVNQMIQNLESSQKTAIKIKPDDQKILNNEKQAIQKFSDNTGIDPEFERTIHYSYGDLDTFTTNDVTYIVNRNTGRVLSQRTNKIEPDIGDGFININEGLTIAENYAKEKCPEFWQKDPDVMIKKLSQTAKNDELTYYWRQYFKPDITSTISQEIGGFNKIEVTLDARNGQVISYNEWYVPMDTNLDLNPELSEEQAWEKVKENLDAAGIGPSNATNRKNLGLVIAIDDTNIQHLAWQFEIEHNNNNRNYYGGQIIVDAHNGQIIRHIKFG